VIHHTCLRCKRHFELDPIFVGFELNKLKKKAPSFYQAECPACRAVNKVSVKEMQTELDAAAPDVQKMIAEEEQRQAEAKAAQQAAQNSPAEPQKTKKSKAGASTN
jgi:hypothetical protein